MLVFLEFFGLLLFELLFTTPGGVIKWAYFNLTGRKTTLKESITQNVGLNYLLSITLTVLIVGLIHLVSI